MKRFFLFLVLFLFIAGFATLAWGFWNAKETRAWTKEVGRIKAQHDISGKVKGIEERMNASGGKTAAEFDSELAVFTADLDAVSKELSSAREETEEVGAPPAARAVAAKLASFYAKSEEQTRNMKNIAEFLGGVFDEAVIFDRMKPEATVQDVRNMIGEAKAKSAEIKVDILPEELRVSGNELKVATENYLDQFDQFATGKVETHDQLNASYENFSQKANDFLAVKKKYFDKLENLDALGREVEADLAKLEEIKFSVK